jgi:putative SOS response-associated peptidase YedK
MCGRFALYSSLDDILREFDVQWSALAALRPRYNVAPTQPVAVVVRRHDALWLEEMRWGLIPFWAKDEPSGAPLINARVETLGTKPSFREAFRSRRCLVLADGFFEWQQVNGAKIPHFVRMTDGRPFGMAGVFDVWQREGEELINSCAIVTMPASETLGPIHSRMPVIVPTAFHTEWLAETPLEAGSLSDLLEQVPASVLEAHAVSTLVNSPANDVPEVVKSLSTLGGAE